MDRPAPARPPTCRGRWVVVAAPVVRPTRPGAAAGAAEGPAAGGCRSGPPTVGRAGPGATRSGAGAGRTNATVVRVVDGDTIVADVDGRQERVRFIGIDTPESVKPRSPVECFGKEASEQIGRAHV